MQDNKYQITKTVRFKLEPEDEEELSQIKKELLKIQDENNDEVNLEDYLNQKSDDDNANMSELLSLKRKIIDVLAGFKHLIFKPDTNGYYTPEYYDWRSIDIKYTFLRNYLKYSFYRFKEEKYPEGSKNKPPKSYKLYDKDIQFFRDEIVGGEQKVGDGLFQRFNEIVAKIDEFNDSKYINQYQKQRYADIALVLGSLTKVNNLEFLKELVSSLVIPNNDDNDLEDDKEKLIIEIQELENLVNKKLAFYIPFKSSMGFQTRGGSFNYYTINKDAKALEEQERKLLEELNKPYQDMKDRSNILGILKITNRVAVDFYVDKRIQLLKPEFRTEEKKGEIRKKVLAKLNLSEGNLDTKLSLNIKETYKFIKLWKGDQKSKFIEHLKTYDNPYSKTFADNCILFKFDVRNRNRIHPSDLFNNLMSLVQEERKYSDELGKKGIPDQRKKQLKAKIKVVREKKSKIFFYKDGMVNYTNLCNFFKSLAIKYGQIKAKLAGIEKDKIQARLLHYWCVIMEENGNKYLYMIPRDSNDNIKKAYNEIKEESHKNPQSGDSKLYYFESLTLSALRKLCFKERNNSFSAKFPNWFPECEQIKEQVKLDANGKEVTKIDRKTGKEVPIIEKVPTTEVDRILYFQFALKQLIKENILQISEDSPLIAEEPQYFNNTLEKFEIELNKNCYKKVAYINSGYCKVLSSEYKAIRFKITSKDFNSKSELNPRYCFTTNLWNNFWNDDLNEKQSYPIRLNPEVKIFWRAAKPSRVKKYLNNSTRKAENKNNRYVTDQFTVAFTFIENALTPRLDYSFVEHSTENSYGKLITTKVYDVDANIQKFNKEMNDRFDFAFAIGIDVGNNELASMAVIGKDRKPIPFPALEIKSDKMDYSKVGLRKKVYYLADKKNLRLFKNKDLYDKVFADGSYEETLKMYFDNINGEYILKASALQDYKEGYQIHFAIENISYFLKKELYDYTFGDGLYEETLKEIFGRNIYKNVSAIDLTKAKIIDGKIVLNADLSTHQKLKLLRAQRLISRTMRVDPNAQLDSTNPNYVSLVSTENPQGKIIFFNNNGDYDSVMADSETLEILQKHRAETEIDLAKIEDRINNYRKALVANMVGVISRVYKITQEKFGRRTVNTSNESTRIEFEVQPPTLGYIAFEGLKAETLQAHFNKFEADISVPLRIALLKKLQVVTKPKAGLNGNIYTLEFDNLVPPFAEINKLTNEQKFVTTYNDTNAIVLEKGDYKQFGIIKFVPEANTSQCCPVCGRKPDKNFQYAKTGNLHSRDFRCTCGFDTCNPNQTEDFATIDTTDKVASFNIAKRGIWE